MRVCVVLPALEPMSLHDLRMCTNGLKSACLVRTIQNRWARKPVNTQKHRNARLCYHRCDVEGFASMALTSAAVDTIASQGDVRAKRGAHTHNMRAACCRALQITPKHHTSYHKRCADSFSRRALFHSEKSHMKSERDSCQRSEHSCSVTPRARADDTSSARVGPSKRKQQI